jgi:competence protein ComEC
MLPSLTVAFGLGLVVGSFTPFFPLSVSFFLLLTVFGSTFYERRRQFVPWRITVLFGSLLAGLLYWSIVVERSGIIHSTGSRESEREEELSGRIVAPVQQGPDRLVMIVEPDREEGIQGRSRRIRVTWRAPEQVLFHGDRVTLRAKLRRPAASLNPGGFDYAAYLERQGVGAVATVTGAESIKVLEAGTAHFRWGIWSQLDRWRSSIRLAAIQTLSGSALGIYLGIIIGDRSYLEPELREQFMVTGVVHLLSISGSHLGLVALLVFVMVRQALLFLPSDWLLRLSQTMAPSRAAAVATVLPTTIYACLAGAEIATMRSLLMVLVALLARWLGYERRVFHALAAAALLILLHDPQAVFDISFQLSFVSVFAIAAWLSRTGGDEVAQPDERTILRRSLRWVIDAVVLSGIVTLATMPLVAYYFNQAPWLGVVTNIIAVPVMGMILVPLGLIAGAWQLLAGGLVLPLAGLLQYLIDAFVKGLNLATAVPVAEWYVASPTVPLMLLFYGCVGLAWRNTFPKRLRGVSVVTAGVILCWWLWSPRLFVDGDRIRVTFLDVAQGDSAVLELPEGQVVLIDGGAAYERFDMGQGVVAPFLWNKGIRTIDHVIATHPQLDHVGGLTWVIKHFTVRNYWTTGEQRGDLFYHRLQQALAERGLREQVVYEGKEIMASDRCRLSVLNPPRAMVLGKSAFTGDKGGQGLNNRSIVNRLTCGHHAILFAADIERDSLSRMQQNPSYLEAVEVLKVPHHGALSSLNRDWIAALRPRHAVLSVGRHNRYGHPAPAVVEAYRAQGVQLHRTDRDGGVWAMGRTSDPFLRVYRTRDLTLQPIALSACTWTCESRNVGRLWERWYARL